ncbi:MAG: hypothetical protein QNJ58_16355 [Desulfobacterales bacterium]|nr:hypothetical protein [Desulfobacterales bacterium]
MKDDTSNKKRPFSDRIWYPSEEDYIAFKVFQMISIPLIMILGVLVTVFLENLIWSFFIFLWFFVALGLGLITSARYNAINSTNKKRIHNKTTGADGM